MIRQIAASVGGLAIVVAIVAHALGGEGAAETLGDVAFFALLVAVVLPFGGVRHKTDGPSDG